MGRSCLNWGAAFGKPGQVISAPRVRVTETGGALRYIYTRSESMEFTGTVASLILGEVSRPLRVTPLYVADGIPSLRRLGLASSLYGVADASQAYKRNGPNLSRIGTVWASCSQTIRVVKRQPLSCASRCAHPNGTARQRRLLP
jgi:hypothetical protein